MSTAIRVRAAGHSDIWAAADTLAAAFAHDPVMRWILPDERHRAVGMPRFFATVARHVFVPAGASELALRPDGTVAGTALWTPPNRRQTSPRTDLRMIPALVRALGRRILAGKQVADLLEPHHPAEPHWYLGMIGTAPDARGAGYGNALLRSRLDRIDAEGSTAYLESSNPDNVPYYERFGFTVTDEIRIPGGPPLWLMLRAPR
ncbi:GNAT family N-acetyltransferase [Nocardia mangyaensis]|uniref:GNAT family N-acetyltransferase n=1 Tax=Nocardia mangyaensis TaxID=2213200 RepID=UPI00267719C8|nr:GNAT family N-acetyltransferase [Nocardia mangyaensis]MDO3646661.1 GNAT family N-acetyltransferase [Nocardia mangyaensis]